MRAVQVALFVLLTFGCSSTKNGTSDDTDKKDGTKEGATPDSAVFLEEYVANRKEPYRIYPSSTTDVDESSRLELDVAPVEQPTDPAVLARIRLVTKVYEGLTREAAALQTNFETLSAVDARSLSASQSKKLKADKEAHNGRFLKLVETMEEQYATLPDKRGIRDPQTVFQGGTLWANLTEWIKEANERIDADIKPEKKVLVRAFHYSKSTNVPVHVTNYDTLGRGQLSSNSRNNLTRAHREALDELDGSAKKFVEEAQKADAKRKAAEKNVADGSPTAAERSANPQMERDAKTINGGAKAAADAQNNVNAIAAGYKAHGAGAPKAMIDLGKIPNLKINDRVQIEVVEIDEETNLKDDGIVRQLFEVRARQFGWRLHGSAAVVFARAASGAPGRAPGNEASANRKDWKLNAAALAMGHYRFRDPNWLGRVHNTLNTGIGLHLASLDMEDDAVEFGMGFSASVLDGLLVGGYGWNLMSESDREYYFIGLDLFAMLNSAKKKLPE
ncbi:MAG: hypothetical protein V3T86_09255 [Planctomycetota bacterium]